MKVNLDANWWGLDTSVQLQLQIVAHGSSQLMTDYAAGPIFTATYDPSEAGAPKPSSDKPSIAQRVKNVLDGLPGGSVAAAVIFPLLAVAGVCAFFWIRRQRRARAAKSNRFSKAVDQRMSTISVDWRSTSGAGANAAVRASMAIPRGASFGDNGERPTSIFDNRAGIGALATSEEPVPQMEEMRRARQSVFTTGERQSRISFAPDTRMSYAEKENPRLPSAVRGLNVRSFHQAHSFEEEREDEYDEKHPVPNRELNMSPTQANGPALLQPGEIAARASSDNDREFQREVLQMPAMTLMRTGGKGGDQDFVLPQQSPVPVIPTTAPLSTPGTNAAAYPYGASSFDTTNAVPMPSPVHYSYGPSGAISPSPSSAPSTAQSFTPMNGGMGMLSPTYPTTAASPDALLRVYASQRPIASSSPSAANISTPSAVPTSSANGGMRILYHNEPTTVPALAYPFPASPSAGTGSISTGTGRMSLAPGDNNPFRKSMAASHLDVEHEHTRASNAYTESMYSAGTGPYNGHEHGHGLGDDDEDDEAAYDDHTGHSGWSAHAQ